MGACGRVWGHVAGVGVFGRGSGLWHGWGHVVQVGACGRVWGMWQGVGAYGRGGGRVWGACGRGWGYLVGGQAYVMDGDMWQGWEHVVGCGGM